MIKQYTANKRENRFPDILNGCDTLDELQRNIVNICDCTIEHDDIPPSRYEYDIFYGKQRIGKYRLRLSGDFTPETVQENVFDVDTSVEIEHSVDVYAMKAQGIDVENGFEGRIRNEIAYISSSPAHYHIKAYDDVTKDAFQAHINELFGIKGYVNDR